MSIDPTTKAIQENTERSIPQNMSDSNHQRDVEFAKSLYKKSIKKTPAFQTTDDKLFINAEDAFAHELRYQLTQNLTEDLEQTLYQEEGHKQPSKDITVEKIVDAICLHYQKYRDILTTQVE